MSSDQSRRIINSRERATSTDQNRIVDLSDRNAQMAAWYLQQNDEDPVSGVLTGLRVTVTGASSCSVSSGFALSVDDGTKSYPDAPYRWIEALADITNVTVPAATNRWVAIEIAPGTQNTISTSVDVFDPTTGAFVPTTLLKEVQPLPVVTTNVGTVDFEFPVPTAGTLPLAYIFRDGGGSIGTGILQVVHCRPLLWSKAPFDFGERFLVGTSGDGRGYNKAIVQGGGVTVAADGTTVDALACSGKFWKSRMAFSVPRGAQFDLSNTNAWDETGIANGANAYLYAAKPPYQTGYGNIADREFIVGNDVQSQFATVTTTVSTVDFQANCIVIASTIPPAPGIEGPQGAPLETTADIGDTPFRTSGAVGASDRNDWVYLGAMDWDTVPEAKQQTFVLGESRVVLNGRFVGNSINSATGSPGATISFDPRQPQSATGSSAVAGDSDGVIPAFVQSMRSVVRLTGVNNGAYNHLLVDDEVPSTGALATNGKQFQLIVEAGVGNDNPVIDLVSTGTTITATEDGADAGGFYEFYVTSYVDPVIASR